MSNGVGIQIKKRDGSVEPLDINKIHFVVEEATEGLTGTSASQIEMTANIQFYDGMSTEEIQEILIKSANDLIRWKIQTINMRRQDFCFTLSIKKRLVNTIQYQ